MTSTEIKTEIQKVINNIPESALHDVLEVLTAIQTKSTSNLEKHFEQILLEDNGLLERLAQ